MKAWHCNACEKQFKSEDSVTVFYHSCPPFRRARRWVPPEIEGTTLEELWSRIFGDFAGGTPAPPSREVAAEETGRHRQDPRIEETDR